MTPSHGESSIFKREAAILNFYRASELHGGLVMGMLAQRTRDPELMLELTRHAAEEVMHAQLWTETMLALGMRPTPVRQTSQDRYAAASGTPTTVLEVLALTQVFERRVCRHFQEHLRRPGTHELVKATLRRMLADEAGHISWIKHWLDRESVSRRALVQRTLDRYTLIDREVYAAWRADIGWESAA